MQIKKPLRYFSESHAVYQEVELHFLKKKIELPPEWEDLVAIACFPNQVIEQKFCHGYESEQDSTGAWVIKRDTKTGHPVKAYRKETPFAKELLAFQACFARDTDLTLEILTLARKCLARYDEKNCDTQDGRVRAFLVKYGNSAIISDSGKLRLPKKNEFAEWTNAELFQGKRKELKIKIVPVAPLQDGQIAALQANKTIQAPAGATENQPSQILSPHPGLDSIPPVHPRFHRGLLSSVALRLRAVSNYEKAVFA